MQVEDYEIRASQSALIIVDMQKGFLTEDAPLEVKGGTILIPRILKLLKKIRTLNIPVIWTRVTLDNVHRGAYRMLKPHLFTDTGDPLIGKNTGLFNLVDELLPHVDCDDIIIDKDRYSSFHQTNLDLILKQKGIRNIILCGITTNICIESTIRDAFQLDYFPFVLSDCTMSFSKELHDYSLKIISHSFGFVITSDDLLNRFK